MAISEQQIEEFASRTNRPIPGQSLTQDPDNPATYERPPSITTKEKGVNYLMDLILADEAYSAIMDALDEGVPVMDLVQGILVNAFEEGVFNPDLMLLLAEPLAYLLLGLSERQGIRARIVNDPDEPYDPDDLDNWDYAEEEPTENSRNSFQEKLKSIKKPKADKDLNLDKVIENASSLMSKPSKTNSKQEV
tara:strand:+ start:1851 stop:2426 length:576 start_codon:yes stop_codon:yes gene_type:complete